MDVDDSLHPGSARPSLCTASERREMTYMRELGWISGEEDRRVVEDPLLDVTSKKSIVEVEEVS